MQMFNTVLRGARRLTTDQWVHYSSGVFLVVVVLLLLGYLPALFAVMLGAYCYFVGRIDELRRYREALQQLRQSDAERQAEWQQFHADFAREWLAYQQRGGK